MSISVYADESGTHDETGLSPGGSFALIAGWAAHDETWEGFSGGWQKILSKYNVPYFHFAEFSVASAIKRNPQKSIPSNYARNPYKDLELSELDNFFDDCARVLDDPNLELVCSIFEKKAFHRDKAKITHPIASMFVNDPYNYLVHDFFKRSLSQIFKRWGTKEGVTFVFDDAGDGKWKQRIEIVVEAYRLKGFPIKQLYFKNKAEALPIQAADMVGYRTTRFPTTWKRDDMPIKCDFWIRLF